jgi:UDP-N-acetylenolpyruvoylglucosamine reductase
VREEEPIARHLPLRAGGTFELWAEVHTEAELASLVKAARAEKHTIRPVFPFADAVPPEGGLTGLALRLGGVFEQIREVEEGLWVGASVPLALLGLRRGFEMFARAPGTLGDAVEEGWIAPAIARIRRFKGRSFEEIEEAAGEGKSLVVAALVRPGVKLVVPRAGQAWLPVKRRDIRELFRSLALAGLRLGDAALGEDDPVVVVNRGDATAKQLRLLREAVRERVHTATGIELVERIAPPGRGGRL